MYIQVCDRCGRKTKNKPAFLLPTNKEKGNLQVNGIWFGADTVTLCNNCLIDFEDFRTKHEFFNRQFVEEDNFDGMERYQI